MFQYHPKLVGQVALALLRCCDVFPASMYSLERIGSRTRNNGQNGMCSSAFERSTIFHDKTAGLVVEFSLKPDQSDIRRFRLMRVAFVNVVVEHKILNQSLAFHLSLKGELHGCPGHLHV